MFLKTAYKSPHDDMEMNNPLQGRNGGDAGGGSSRGRYAMYGGDNILFFKNHFK